MAGLALEAILGLTKEVRCVMRTQSGGVGSDQDSLLEEVTLS